MPFTDHSDVDVQIKARLKQLPAAVRTAIASVDIKRGLQALSKDQQLHLDQWQLLEDEVMFAILGLEKASKLKENIEKHVGISTDVAATLSDKISNTIFEPIRQELERLLEHPEAQEKQLSAVQTARDQAIAEAQPTPQAPKDVPPQPASTPITPATPPQPTPDVKVTRPSESSAYKPGEASAMRKNISDDPYREPAI